MFRRQPEVIFGGKDVHVRASTEHAYLGEPAQLVEQVGLSKPGQLQETSHGVLDDDPLEEPHQDHAALAVPGEALVLHGVACANLEAPTVVSELSTFAF